MRSAALGSCDAEFHSGYLLVGLWSRRRISSQAEPDCSRSAVVFSGSPLGLLSLDPAQCWRFEELQPQLGVGQTLPSGSSLLQWGDQIQSAGGAGQ
ncbi:Hypothetical predicted protein [Marmota monax]|uniref:Uncharacterized protein n=1 Tax=Marmota monax TaxID=9995 RepID=A0A5E4AH77_MARMO|nr:Hypothetical predicted protein [Marmota monax]